MIGRGLFNPESQYRVRMLASSSEKCFKMPLNLLLLNRISEAAVLRRQIHLPSIGSTNAYRLVNGEGDRLGGLVIDVLANSVVIQSSAYWVLLNPKTVTSIITNT